MNSNDEELVKENNTQKLRVEGIKQLVPFYNLNVIISVGYRVKSKRGIAFRKWADAISKDHMRIVVYNIGQHKSIFCRYAKPK